MAEATAEIGSAAHLPEQPIEAFRPPNSVERN